MLTRFALSSLMLAWGGIACAGEPPAKAPFKSAPILKLTADKPKPTAGTLVTVKADTDAKTVRLKVVGDAQTYADSGGRTLAVVPNSGKVVVIGVAASDAGDLSEIVELVVADGVVPTPPKPPVPPVPPTPDVPAPIPAAGLHVLVVYDALQLTKMTATQQGAIYAKDVRDYLRATCPKGDDGETPEVRMWSQDTDATGESKLWRDAFARPRKSVPWVIVSNGKTGFEGPLPGSAADMLKLLKTYGDK
jgi:hypothetical protein